MAPKRNPLICSLFLFFLSSPCVALVQMLYFLFISAVWAGGAPVKWKFWGSAPFGFKGACFDFLSLALMHPQKPCTPPRSRPISIHTHSLQNLNNSDILVLFSPCISNPVSPISEFLPWLTPHLSRANPRDFHSPSPPPFFSPLTTVHVTRPALSGSLSALAVRGPLGYNIYGSPRKCCNKDLRLS